MDQRKEKLLLREYIRRTLKEDWSDYGGVTPWSAGYGGSSSGTKASSGYGTGGNSLYSIFIDPFVQATKVIGAELGQTAVRVAALMTKGIELALESLIPGFKANYDKIDKVQKKNLERIKEAYKPAYDAVAENWDHPDIKLFAFMHSPTTWLTYQAITSKPEAALSVYEAIAEGSNTLTLYLRDIRNRLFGAQTPGAGIPASSPMPVKTENIRRTLKGILRENGDVTKTIKFKGLEISIDRPEGFVQTGTNSKGEDWERVYLYDYGFIKDTEGGDGEDLDVFVGPNQDVEDVYIVTQNHDDGSFDEYKAFVGFESEDDALNAYEAHIPIEFFSSVSTIPVGVLKGMLGQDPMTEALSNRPKTPAEQLADILTSEEFQHAIEKLPIVKKMQQDAAALDNQSTTQLQSAMAPILSAKNANDLASASGGAWHPPQEYAGLSQEEKNIYDDTVVKQVKSSMATYYQSRLNELLNQSIETGINDQSAYVASLRRMISSLEPVKQAAAQNGVNHNGKQEKERSGTSDSAGRAQGTGQVGRGVRKQAPGSGRGDRLAKGGPQGNNRGVLGTAGHKDTESGSTDSKDKDIK
jgi:hypothetical protein